MHSNTFHLSWLAMRLHGVSRSACDSYCFHRACLIMEHDATFPDRKTQRGLKRVFERPLSWDWHVANSATSARSLEEKCRHGGKPKGSSVLASISYLIHTFSKHLVCLAIDFLDMHNGEIVQSCILRVHVFYTSCCVRSFDRGKIRYWTPINSISKLVYWLHVHILKKQYI